MVPYNIPFERNLYGALVINRVGTAMTRIFRCMAFYISNLKDFEEDWIEIYYCYQDSVRTYDFVSQDLETNHVKDNYTHHVQGPSFDKHLSASVHSTALKSGLHFVYILMPYRYILEQYW